MLNHSHSANEMPFTLLVGGVYQCDPAWNKPADAIDRCYKLYYPISGKSRLVLKKHDLQLRSGHIYLIPGNQLVRQECAESMEVYWIHFIPRSLHMMMCLANMKKIYRCDPPSQTYWESTCKALPEFFIEKSQDLFYRVQAMLLDLTSQLLAAEGIGRSQATDPAFEQLKPAIDFMDQHLTENPRLEEIAKVAHLSPNYFHRKFAATFQVTPFHYMQQLRLDRGRQLLLNTDLTLQSIAKRCGFYCEFHFSKTFKKHYGLSPTHFRKRAVP